jgi:hypothetical protein
MGKARIARARLTKHLKTWKAPKEIWRDKAQTISKIEM